MISTNLLNFSINEANTEQIVEHLRICDLTFIPPLSERVEIKDYAKKLIQRAMRFEVWEQDNLVGFVAVYCNDQANATAYITNVSVISRWQGYGIASQLIENCIAYITKQDFAKIKLEVDSRNLHAINLYKKHGFSPDITNNYYLTMFLLVNKLSN